MAQNKNSIEILEEQKKRLAALQERRTRAEVRLETERKALEEARADALRLFGTNDLDALRNLYRERQDDNDRKVVEFMLALDTVEQKLSDIERQVSI